MSGGQFKNLLRGANLQSTVGIGCSPTANKYASLSDKAKIDYSSYNRIISQSKHSGASALKRISKLTDKSNQIKEACSAHKHFERWEVLARCLSDEYWKLVSDIDQYFIKLIDGAAKTYSHLVFDAKACEEQLKEDRHVFHHNTIFPITLLCEDLNQVLTEHLKSRSHILQPDRADAMSEEILKIKCQQKEILNTLSEEQIGIEEQLEIVADRYSLHCDWYSEATDVSQFEQFITPSEHLTKLEWPNMESADIVINQFNQLVMHCLSRLDYLQTKYNSSDFDIEELDIYVQERLKLLIKQYPTSLGLSRQLLLDRLHKEFPSISRDTYKRFEEWYLGLESFIFQKRLLLKSLIASVDAFTVKTKACHEEEWALYNEKIIFQQDKKKRMQDLATNLKELKNWKLQRLEYLEREEEIAFQKWRVEQRDLKLEDEARRLRADINKSKVEEYKQKRKFEQETLQMEQEKQLEGIRLQLASRMKRDRVNIAYRQEMYDSKLRCQQDKLNEEAAMKRSLKERVSLRHNQYLESIPNEPIRICQDTVSSKHRHQTDSVSDTPLQAPLFSVSSYTSEQIMHDQRVRVEQALRCAGLLQSEYAQSVIKHLSPPKQYRRDQKSNLFTNK